MDTLTLIDYEIEKTKQQIISQTINTTFYSKQPYVKIPSPLRNEIKVNKECSLKSLFKGFFKK